MKLSLIYIFPMLILASCATSKTATVTSTTPPPTTAPTPTATLAVTTAGAEPSGDWNYVVTGTPDGDFKGVLAVSGEGAKLISDQGVTPLNNFSFAKDTGKLTGTFPYNGMQIDLNATMEGEQLKGTMSTQGMSFPFSATKKK
jgi:hypothetical protein